MDLGSSSDVGEGPFINGLSDVDHQPNDTAPLSSERSGVLFDNLSGGDEAAVTDRMQRFVPDDVFPVNKPPPRKNKKERVNGPVAKRPRGSGDVARATKKQSKGVAAASASASSYGTTTSEAVATGKSGVAGTAANPCQLPCPPVGPGPHLLDDRVVADTDEVYDDNEMALSEFIRMHPMLRYVFCLSNSAHACAHTLSHFSAKCFAPQHPIRSAV